MSDDPIAAARAEERARINSLTQATLRLTAAYGRLAHRFDDPLARRHRKRQQARLLWLRWMRRALREGA